MPRFILYVLLAVTALTLVPMGLIYRSQHSRKADPRIQVVYDMDDQFHYKPQEGGPFFADGRVMRAPVAGTVPRGRLADDDPFWKGTVQDDTLFVDTFPVALDQELLDRGQERFNIYCAPCHGLSGNGNGMVNIRAQALAEGTWTPPTDLTGQSVVDRPAGHIFNTITNGIRSMPAYRAQIEPADRWAIVAYVRALQVSRNASLEDVPAEARGALQR
ncbi:MAG: cytochrome c [Candidatus Krumholzibacteriia bacterium]